VLLGTERLTAASVMKKKIVPLMTYTADRDGGSGRRIAPLNSHRGIPESGEMGHGKCFRGEMLERGTLSQISLGSPVLLKTVWYLQLRSPRPRRGRGTISEFAWIGTRQGSRKSPVCEASADHRTRG
jgi:hypothetical protein